MAVIRPAALLAALAALLACLAPGAASAAAAAGPRWQPAPQTAPWQWQLQGKLDLSVPAAVYEVDGFETSAAEVRALHQRGRRAICYLDVGSWESYRPDRDRFPATVIGRRYEGFPDERWLDVSRFHRFKAPLAARIAMCARKGFDAVEPDNLAGYENETGFEITAADQLRFNRWIARVSHRWGMAVALKNDPRQARQLVADFDFAVVESCFEFDECDRFLPFVRQGKAVFLAEYGLSTAEFCRRAIDLSFSAIRKSYDLFAQPWEPCVTKPGDS